MNKEVSLRVKEAMQEEAYKGIVRVDSQYMKDVGVRPGDIVEIEGSRKTVGIVDRAYPTDVGEAVIRMDGIVRRNAKTGIGEEVKIRKIDVKEAKKITIAPSQQGIMIQADPSVFTRGLLGRVVVRGDIVALGGSKRRRSTFTGSPFEDIFEIFEQGFMGSLGSLKFIIAETTPVGTPIIITENTEIKISPKSMQVTEEELILPDVTYEDIGGLDDEIKKIREMVELPLRHPEIFQTLGIEPPQGVLLHGSPGTGKTLLAKAVANESEANFILINGPEIMNKFYGECVASDSIVLTNGSGLKTIGEAVNDEESKHIAGINMDTQKAEILPISDVYDKGIQDTLTIVTPYGELTSTPTSKLLKLNKLSLEWSDVKDLKEGDKIAISKKLPFIEKIPQTVDFFDNKTVLKGKIVEDLLNSFKPKEIASKLGITLKKYHGHKYNKTAPAWLIKKLISIANQQVNGSFELMHANKKLPAHLDEKLMYILGLLAGDGHLRYTKKGKHVTTIILSNSDREVIDLYKRYIKEIFNVGDIKQTGKYDYYFSSPAIGNFLSNLGIPYNNKSKTISVPNYAIFLPDNLLASYLRGLYDTDGYVHLPKSGKQIIYYTMSKNMANSLKMVLLRFGILSNIRRKKDGTYEISINEKRAIDLFKEKIGFNHTERKLRLSKEIKTKYTKNSYNRLPITNYLKDVIKELNISKRFLLKKGINLNTNGLDNLQISKLIKLLNEKGANNEIMEKIKLLDENDILWSPIRKIEASRAHVYDFTVPNNHNFIANGFIVHNSEKRIRRIFEEASEKAPSIIFIDEIDAIAPKREETHGEVERRVVAQLLAMMDGLNKRGKVVVIGATNRPNSLDPALRRPGRFDREIVIGVPSKKGRLDILKIHTRNMPLTKSVNLDELAGITHGFVGADLQALAKEAAMNVLRRILPEIKLKEKETISQDVLDKLKVTSEDFKSALKIVRPSAMREVLVEKPNVKWEDIGGLDKIKQELNEVIEWPLKHSDAFERIGIRPPRGVLLYGPPGTGKTLLAKAVAAESEANFINVKGPELVSMWVGESLPYDEELIVKKDGRIIRMKIGDIVKNREDVEVLAFDKEKRVIFSKIDDYIQHPLTSNLVEITTRTGRRIKVTTDHSVFSFVNGRFGSLPSSHLIPNESYIAIPKRLNLPRERIKTLNLYEGFKNDNSVFVDNVKEYLIRAKLILGLEKTSSILGISKKYLADIICKNLPVPIINFDNLMKEAKLRIDFDEVKIKLKGSVHSYPSILKVDEDFWRLLGIWIAEGDFNGYTVRIHNCNPEIRKDILRIAKKCNFSISELPSAITINSLLVQKIFKNILGLKEGAKNKNIPPIIFMLDKESKSNFLKGYFSGDGSIPKGEKKKFSIEAGTVSETLANDLMYLLLDFGIVAFLRRKKERTGSTTHQLMIFGVKNFENFKDIGFIDKSRNAKIKKYINSRKWSRSDLIPLSGELFDLVSQHNNPMTNLTIGKERLKQMLVYVDKDKTKYKEYWDIVEGDIFFDLVKEIKIIDNEEFVYDISVPDGQNFVAGFGGIFAHNSEKGIRKIFEKARQSAPTIIFFDEIDSIAARRGLDPGSKATERMVNQLLSEVDGLEELHDVIVIGATNRPDMLDPALLRPGRFDRIIMTPVPDQKAREEIFKVHTKSMPISKSIDIKKLAEQTNNYVGSDIEAVCREAGMLALRNNINTKEITAKDFKDALDKIKPSITEQDIKTYQEIEQKYLRTARGAAIREVHSYMG